MIGRIAFLIFLIAIPIGIIFFQIYLSRKENRWLGLILPFISFGISLFALFGILLLSVSQETTTAMVDGEIVEQVVVQMNESSSIIFTAIYIFVLYNIPTGILLAIYGACRGKRKKLRDLDKMSVQDL